MDKLISEALTLAIPLIKKWEGCKLQAYKCPAGIWTIGYGETKGVKQGDVWTQQRAETALEERVADFARDVLSVCPQLVAEPARRLAACVSLAYNIGVGAFSKSTVCRKTTEKKYSEAGLAFLMWNKAGGRVLSGLCLRREDERRMYLGGQ
jgi:lysozyme